jgi:two-component system response regulator DegU
LLQAAERLITILVVDRRLVRSALAEMDATLFECSSGMEALEAYASYRPDIVLMDIRMPRMDGLATTKQILLRHPWAKILIVTDYDEDALPYAAREAGACGYALKLNLLDLVPRIRSVLVDSAPKRRSMAKMRSGANTKGGTTLDRVRYAADLNSGFAPQGTQGSRTRVVGKGLRTTAFDQSL